VRVTEVGSAPQTVQSVTVSVKLIVRLWSVAVAGISLVASVVLVVNPLSPISV
jgi:hypothetical protein